ncbi:hypothetical protein ACOMHN_007147 [Nucella lapillus]
MSEAAAGWSQTLLGLKLLTSLQQGSHSALPLLPSPFTPSCLSSPPAVGGCPAPSPSYPQGPPRSVLHPDNQRALARQGYYGDLLEMAEEEGENGGGHQKADARRKQFHKARSRAQHSQDGDEDQESRDSQGDSLSRQDSLMRSMAYSTATESTDSTEGLPTLSGLTSPLPTTPESVFTDRTPAVPRLVAGGPSFSLDRVSNIEDLYLPHHRDSLSSKLQQYRERMTAKGTSVLGKEEDYDDDDDVSMDSSRQSTLDRSVSREGKEKRDCRELPKREIRVDQEKTDCAICPNRDIVGDSADSFAAEATDAVSSAADSENPNESSNETPHSAEQSRDRDQTESDKGGMMSFLILKTVTDRLSDSGSDYTLLDTQDHLSSSSESPQPAPSGEYSEVFSRVQTPQTHADPDTVVLANGSAREKLNGHSEATSGHSNPENPDSSITSDLSSPHNIPSKAAHFISGNGAEFEEGNPRGVTLQSPNPRTFDTKGNVPVTSCAASQGVSSRVSYYNAKSQCTSGGSKIPGSLSSSTVRGGIEGRESVSGGESGERCQGSNGGEGETMLYVYHPTNRLPTTGHQDSVKPKGEESQVPGRANGNQTEELPRMSSIQSDSSGFGDAEISGQSVTPDNMTSLKVSNLGGSCDSSSTTVTTASSVRLTNGGHTPLHNSLTDLLDIAADSHPASAQVHTEKMYGHPKISQSATDLRSDVPVRPLTSSQRVVSMCYIPALSSKRAAGPPERRNIATSYVSSPSQNPAPNHSGVSKSEISVVLDNKQGTPRAAFPKEGQKSVPVSRHYGGEVAKRERKHPPSSSTIHTRPLSDYVSDSSGVFVNLPSEKRGEISLSEELTLALSQGELFSSTPLVTQGSSTRTLKLTLQRPTLPDSASVDSSTRETEDDTDREDRRLQSSAWSQEMLSSADGLRGRGAVEMMGTGEGDSAGEGSSVCSGISKSDNSIASGPQSDLLGCQRLIRLINQPTVVKGRKTQLLHYRPKRHLRDWSTLQKRKRLQEETRLAQYAIQKFKAELGIMDTSVTLRHHAAFNHMTPEQREDVEELRHLWSEVQRHAMETEQLLTSRITSVTAGNESFESLASINVLQTMTDLLKEQSFQKQLATTDEDDDRQEEEYSEDYEEEEEEEEEEWRRGRHPPHSRGYNPRFHRTGSWDHFPRHFQSRLKGRHSSSTSHLAWRSPPRRSQQPFLQELRGSLLSEIRKEMRSSLQSLQQGLQVSTYNTKY